MPATPTVYAEQYVISGNVVRRMMDGVASVGAHHLTIVGNSLIDSSESAANFWKPEYGSRLKGYFKEDGTFDKTKLLLDHDDFDCLDDLETAGLIQNVGTMVNPYAELTKKGAQISSLLTLHKQKGGMYAEFDYKKKMEEYV